MDLVLLVCLAGDPSNCGEERLALAYTVTTPVACLIEAPAVIAEWSDQNPGRQVARWRCAPAEREAKRAWW